MPRDELERAIAAGHFIESTVFSGNIYGTSKQAIEDVMRAGRICVLDIDRNGVMSIKQTTLNPRYVFIKPPSLEVLAQRLRGRQTESADSIASRLAVASEDMDFAQQVRRRRPSCTAPRGSIGSRLNARLCAARRL